MSECIEKNHTYTQRSEAVFQESGLVQDAVFRNLEIIGEASSSLSTALKERHPEIPWREIIASRNFLVHVYHAVSLKVVWKTIVNDLPVLEAAIAAELHPDSP